MNAINAILAKCGRRCGVRLIAGIAFFALSGAGRAGVLNYDYDAAGRLVSVAYAGGTNTIFSYDNNGNLASLSTFVSTIADLGIAQSAAPAPVAAGVALNYTVTVFNNSSNSASGVSVSDALPPNATFGSVTASQGSPSHVGNTISWPVGSLTNGASAIMNFSVRPAAPGFVTNTASVSVTPSDPISGDNSNVLVTVVVAPPTVIPAISGGAIMLSWPVAGGDGFTLEYTTNLTAPVNWLPVPVTPVIMGGTFSVEDALTTTNRFYRLVSP